MNCVLEKSAVRLQIVNILLLVWIEWKSGANTLGLAVDCWFPFGLTVCMKWWHSGQSIYLPLPSLLSSNANLLYLPTYLSFISVCQSSVVSSFVKWGKIWAAYKTSHIQNDNWKKHIKRKWGEIGLGATGIESVSQLSVGFGARFTRNWGKKKKDEDTRLVIQLVISEERRNASRELDPPWLWVEEEFIVWGLHQDTREYNGLRLPMQF